MISEQEAFPLPLDGRFVGDLQWKLLAPFEYRNPPTIINVPVGFVSDGGSIPKFAWSLIGSPWSGKYPKACVPHDWGYHIQERPRAEVDKNFLEGMKILGVGWWKRGTMYNCVRIVAWICWKQKARTE